jgi:hypothetical protein
MLPWAMSATHPRWCWYLPEPADCTSFGGESFKIHLDNWTAAGIDQIHLHRTHVNADHLVPKCRQAP